jgi:hypothetical protein
MMELEKFPEIYLELEPSKKYEFRCLIDAEQMTGGKATGTQTNIRKAFSAATTRLFPFNNK